LSTDYCTSGDGKKFCSDVMKFCGDSVNGNWMGTDGMYTKSVRMGVLCLPMQTSAANDTRNSTAANKICGTHITHK